MSKKWTEDEIRFLEDRWGNMSVQGIAKYLGRSYDAVKIKAQRIGLTDALLYFDGISLNQLSYALNISYSKLKSLVKDHGFPAKSKIFTRNKRVLMVRYDDFWKWAEENKQMIDFAKVEENILGPEPEWVKIKRSADQLNKIKVRRDPWTPKDDAELKGLLKAHCFTYPEIARRLRRTQGAVKRRIIDLGLKERPVRLDNHVKYTDEEVKQLVEMYEKGYSFEVIGEKLNKSALGIRGKLERMGYKFRNGVPIKTA
jgi:hypothetical protein